MVNITTLYFGILESRIQILAQKSTTLTEFIRGFLQPIRSNTVPT
jgi:hypothetical protein